MMRLLLAALLAGASWPGCADEALRYRQDFDALPDGLWIHNLDLGGLKGLAGHARIAPACGVGGSACLRIVFRHAGGIDKQPPSSPVFITKEQGTIRWAMSDKLHSNTATDVIQANIAIDGTTDGRGRAWNPPLPEKEYTLRYRLFFEPGFDFAKGGKLPGLAALGYDSGCTEDGDAKRRKSNWSVRLMWRANGRLALYPYDQTRPSGGCGANLLVDALPGDPAHEMPGKPPKDKKFRFRPGVWYTVVLAVRVNDNDSVTYRRDASGELTLDAAGMPIPVAGNGEVSLHVRGDGAPGRMLVYRNVPLRDECGGPCRGSVPDTRASWVNAIFFSTFYGGNETKRRTCLQGSPPPYPGLTQERFEALCKPQRDPALYPSVSWAPSRPSAVRFDDVEVVAGYRPPSAENVQVVDKRHDP